MPIFHNNCHQSISMSGWYDWFVGGVLHSRARGRTLIHRKGPDGGMSIGQCVALCPCRGASLHLGATGDVAQNSLKKNYEWSVEAWVAWVFKSGKISGHGNISWNSRSHCLLGARARHVRLRAINLSMVLALRTSVLSEVFLVPADELQSRTS